VISSRSSFWRSTAEEISSSSFAQQIHLIVARSFLRSRCRSKAFGAQVSLPWSIVDRTQAVNTLPLLHYNCTIIKFNFEKKSTKIWRFFCRHHSYCTRLMQGCITQTHCRSNRAITHQPESLTCCLTGSTNFWLYWSYKQNIYHVR